MNAMLGDLPTWKLSDLYSSPTGTDLDQDLKRADQQAEVFAKAYEGKVAGLDGKALGKAGFRFLGTTICYAFMQASGMVDDHLTSCFRHGLWRG